MLTYKEREPVNAGNRRKDCCNSLNLEVKIFSLSATFCLSM